MRQPLRAALLVLAAHAAANAVEINRVEAVPFLGAEPSVEIGTIRAPIPQMQGPRLAPGLEAVFQPDVLPIAEVQRAVNTEVPLQATLPSVAESLRQANTVVPLTAQADIVSRALQNDGTGLSGRDQVDKIYLGNAGRRDGGSGAVFAGQSQGEERDRLTPEGLTIGPAGTRGQIDPSAREATFILNDERIPITGRAADYYLETKRMERVLTRKGVSLAESLDVMDDSFRDTLAKLKIIEKVGAQDSLAQNVHLPETLTWVDAVTMKNGQKTAVHTTQVYFHHAEGAMKSASEIAEGIRRVDKAIDQQLEFFKRDGKADKEIAKVDPADPTPLDKVILGFDTRGYQQIRDHIKAKEAAIRAEHGDRFSFVFLDDKDAKLSNREVRAQLTPMVKKYKGHGLQRIVEGVTYSRYTGLLLELKGIEYRLAQGATIVQSGRDMFNDGVDDPSRRGMYETELDVVSRARDGRLDMDEEKSARVALSQDDVLDDKFIYKLDAYQRNRGLIQRTLGGIPRINFVVDVGGLKREAALQGQVQWKNPRQLALIRFLQAKEQELSRKYGYEVKFVFLSSYPGVDPLLVEKWLQANDDPANDKAVLKADKRESKKAERIERRRARRDRERR